MKYSNWGMISTDSYTRYTWEQHAKLLALPSNWHCDECIDWQRNIQHLAQQNLGSIGLILGTVSEEHMLWVQTHIQTLKQGHLNEKTFSQQP